MKFFKPEGAIETGFHRIGLCMAVPLSLIAVGILIGALFEPHHERLGMAGFALGSAIAAIACYSISMAAAWVLRGFFNK